MRVPNDTSADEQRFHHESEKKRIAKLVAAMFDFMGDDIIFTGKMAEILGELYSMWRVNVKALERLDRSGKEGSKEG